MNVLEKNDNGELPRSNKISIIILCCDEKPDITATLKSLVPYKDRVAECIIADAAGGIHKEEIERSAESIFSQKAKFTEEKLPYGEKPQINIRYCSLAEKVYQNMAQLKNDAVKLASCDEVLLVNAGEYICLGDGCYFRTFGGQNISGQSAICDNFRSIFKELLISGRGIVRNIVVSRRMLDVVGGWNPNLDCGEDYELSLRVCGYGLDGGSFGGLQLTDLCGVIFNEENSNIPIFREDYYTYAYVIAKYAGRLKKLGIFDEVFLNRYNEAAGYGIEEYFVSCQENFMLRGELFDKVDEATRAVLVFMEKSACNGALYHIADRFAKALRKQGQNVYTYTFEENEASRNIDLLLEVAAVRRYRAAVEFQAGVFTTQLPSGELVGNVLKCPKFMYEFDHPLYISWHFMLPIKEYYVLSQDETYAEYLREYFINVKGAWHMPLAGDQMNKAVKNGSSPEADEGISGASRDSGDPEKRYSLTFVAAYNNYRNCLTAIRNMTGQERRIALRILPILKNNPNSTPEGALKIVLEEMNISLDDKRTFVTMLHKMRDVVRAVTFYYREKIVRTLVDAGIEIHVFSDTWRKCPFADNDKLVIHHDIPYEEGIEIIAQSRATLNIMSWHKGGMTERVANAMFNKAVCVTDKTTYIEKHFSDGEDIVMFDLENIEALPDRIKELLSENGTAKCQAIAAAAYEKAISLHTWDERAKAFMELLSEIE